MPCTAAIVLPPMRRGRQLRSTNCARLNFLSMALLAAAPSPYLQRNSRGTHRNNLWLAHHSNAKKSEPLVLYTNIPVCESELALCAPRTPLEASNIKRR